MTLANEFLALETELAGEFGQAATLVIPVTSTASNGEVAETSATSVTVTVAGPIDEAKRYASTGTDTRVTATFYLPAQGLTVTPTQGCRLTIETTTWQVIAVGTESITGVTIVYRLDCGQVVT